MALSLGKLTILVGAGIVGSVLAKEGGVSDLVSGAFKIAWRQLKQDDSSTPVKKPRNDLLLAQVNSLRQELQILASNRSVTIINASRNGGKKYGVIIIVAVAGCAYIWWKGGGGLSGLMVATRRSLSDACSSVEKKLENVYSSVSASYSFCYFFENNKKTKMSITRMLCLAFYATKRKLSSQIDGLDRGLEECLETSSRTKEEVSGLRGRTNTIGEDVKSVHNAVRAMETKINSIEWKQNLTNEGVRRLCDVAQSIEHARTTEVKTISSSSARPALEAPPISPTRTESLPPLLMSDPMSSPGSSGSDQDVGGISEAVESSNDRGVINGIGAVEDMNAGASSGGRFRLRMPAISASFLTRTRSATSGLLQQTRSSAI
ncbi:hypothetical protein G4B88_006080 [Cannabis sativa]|uniref:DUF1664 domain-containing protein n=1 Tax=Cannabis sativa TaxID=3483 RepID=A0A7J6IAS9_CANSA|nr:hypothetical protein G4B88_006080 [Cannabis sativa]